jgi:DNA-directed RNA polymerase specialized sigma24 family protein
MGTVSDGRRKESTYDPLLPNGSGHRRHTSAFHRAFSPIEALMSCPPAEDPEESVLEQIALREALADALDNLEEDDRWIFDMLIVVRLSLRFVGRVVGLPKTTLARRRDTIVAGLQEQLLENPVVRERFRDHYDQTL